MCGLSLTLRHTTEKCGHLRQVTAFFCFVGNRFNLHSGSLAREFGEES